CSVPSAMLFSTESIHRILKTFNPSPNPSSATGSFGTSKRRQRGLGWMILLRNSFRRLKLPTAHSLLPNNLIRYRQSLRIHVRPVPSQRAPGYAADRRTVSKAEGGSAAGIKHI